MVDYTNKKLYPGIKHRLGSVLMDFLNKAAVYQICFALMLTGCSSMSTETSPRSNSSPGPPPSSAQAQPPAITQPELQVNPQDDPSLTRGEKVERMDQALSRSLNKFDDRRNAEAQGGGPSSATAGNARGGAAGNVMGSGDGAFPEAELGGSIASSEISGTEVTSQVPGGPAVGSTQITDVTELDPALGTLPPSGGMETSDRTAARISRKPVPGSGTLPEDIPAADNDSVLEAQIRAAAMQEQDPHMRERLWNEYRRYKGLPIKE